MVKRFKEFKRGVIRFFAQSMADYLITKLQTSMDLDESDSFYSVYEQAAKLNAWCIVNHDIYLD